MARDHRIGQEMKSVLVEALYPDSFFDDCPIHQCFVPVEVQEGGRELARFKRGEDLPTSCSKAFEFTHPSELRGSRLIDGEPHSTIFDNYSPTSRSMALN